MPPWPQWKGCLTFELWKEVMVWEFLSNKRVIVNILFKRSSFPLDLLERGHFCCCFFFLPFFFFPHPFLFFWMYMRVGMSLTIHIINIPRWASWLLSTLRQLAAWWNTVKLVTGEVRTFFIKKNNLEGKKKSVLFLQKTVI